MQPGTHPTVALAPQHVRKVICTRRKPFLPPLPPEQLGLHAVAGADGLELSRSCGHLSRQSPLRL